jgi:hypothetical protein
MEDDASVRIESLKQRADEMEKHREQQTELARRLGRQFGGDLQVSREHVIAAMARHKRLQDAVAAAKGAGPTTAPEDPRPAKELEQLANAAANEAGNVADAAAEFQAYHAKAAELGDRLRRLRDQIDDAARAQESREAAVRLVQRATVEP